MRVWTLINLNNFFDRIPLNTNSVFLLCSQTSPNNRRVFSSSETFCLNCADTFSNSHRLHGNWIVNRFKVLSPNKAGLLWSQQKSLTGFNSSSRRCSLNITRLGPKSKWHRGFLLLDATYLQEELLLGAVQWTSLFIVLKHCEFHAWRSNINGIKWDNTGLQLKT